MIQNLNTFSVRDLTEKKRTRLKAKMLKHFNFNKLHPILRREMFYTQLTNSRYAKGEHISPDDISLLSEEIQGCLRKWRDGLGVLAAPSSGEEFRVLMDLEQIHLIKLLE